MADITECPFCSGKPIKKLPYSDKIKSVEGGLGVAEGSGKASIELEPNPEREPYYKCNGCNRKYVDATMDINIIINNLKCAPTIVGQIFHYYHSDISLTDLLRKYNVGMLRKPSHMLSFVSEKIAQRQLYICFIYNGIRTFGTFVKEKENDIEYYKMEMLGIP